MINPKVSIIIVHKDGEEILNNCINSLKKTNYPNFEIVVLLNSTKDNSKEILKKHKIKFYESRKNLGFAGGNNYLINKTKSKYLALINNDTEVEKNWLKELVDFAEKNNADALQPKIKSLNKKSSFEYAGAAGGFIDKYGYPFCRGRIFNTVEKDAGQYNSPMRIFWASGACILIKREILKKTGLFDEDFFMYSEELDLCWRINLAGGKIFNAPKSVIYHLGSYSIKREKVNFNKELLIHRNAFITFLKNYSKKSIIKMIVPRLFLEIIGGIAFPKRLKPILSSFWWIIKNRNQISKKNLEIQKMRVLTDDEISKLMLKKSIALAYFIKKIKTFKELKIG